MATARKTGGSGYAPGYGTVTNRPLTSTGWGGAMKTQIPRAGSPTPTFVPQPTAQQQQAPPAKPKFDPNNLPVDPTYDATQLGLLQRHDTTLARLEAARGTTLLNSGYQATYDANGNATGLTYDPNNPYSQAALAKKTYDASKLGTTNSLASRGQLYSGAMQNAQGYNDSQYATNVDRQQKALLQFLAGNQISKTEANNDYSTGVGQAAGDRLSRALAAWIAQNGG